MRKKPQKGKNPHGGRNQRKSLGCVKTFLKLTVFSHVFNNVDYWIPFEFFLSFVRWFFFFWSLVTWSANSGAFLNFYQKMNLYHESIKYSLIQETSDICKVLLGSPTSSVWRISVTLGITSSENYLSKKKRFLSLHESYVLCNIIQF